MTPGTDSADRDTRLATYGTLAPGRVNHHQLATLQGTWSQGWVMGHLQQAGWGAAHGYPGLILAEDGERVTLHLFTSGDLPDHWDRLDAFEGAEYHRTPIEVQTDEGPNPAWIYTLAQPASGG